MIQRKRTNESFFEYSSNIYQSTVIHPNSQNEQKINEQPGIIIKIQSFKIMGNSITRYVSYSIEGSDRQGQFQTNRRYNDFRDLYQILLINWPGCFVPPIPRKKKTQNFKEQFIEQRKKLLTYFLRSVATKDHIYYGQEMQTFLRSGDLKYQQESYEQITDKYMHYFQVLQGREIGNDINLKIAGFQRYIQNVDQTLRHLKQIARNKMETQKNYFKNLDLYLEMINKYDGQIRAEQNSQATKNSVTDKFANLDMNQGLNGVYQMLEIEILEIQSFNRIIQQRNKYLESKEKAIEQQKSLKNDLHKILAGKTTVNSMFKKDKKQLIVKLEEEINKQNSNIENIAILSDIVTGILGYIEINQFKNQKVETYYNVVKMLSTGINNNTRSVLDIWQKIQNISKV